MSPLSPSISLSCLFLPILFVIVPLGRCSGLLLTKTIFRHSNHSLLCFPLLGDKDRRSPTVLGPVYPFNTLLGKRVLMCPFQGHKDSSWSQASHQECCARKDMHMPAQPAQHPCRWDQLREERRGSAAEGLGARSQLFWIPNRIPLSPPRPFHSLSEAACFLHKLPGGPWMCGSAAHAAPECGWVEHLWSGGGKDITHLSTGHSP